MRDFTPISLTVTSPSVLAVNAALPIHSAEQLIAYAKAHPGQLNFGSAGNGSPAHLAGELFKSSAGVDMAHVPYKGAAPAVTDLVAGRLSLMFSNPSDLMPHVGTGKLRALAVTTAQRSPVVPGLPTIAEAGLPGYEIAQWFGVLAPAGTPREIVERLNSELVAIVAMPEVRETLAERGLQPKSSTPEQFAVYIKAEVGKMVDVVKASGARVD